MDSLEVRRSIRACARCDLYAQPGGGGPVPPTIPDQFRQPRILCLGEAPGRSESRYLRPFIGPAGQLARAWLTEAAIDPDSVAWANVVQCWPKRKPATPSDEEIRACAVNVSAIIEHVKPSYVLIFGGVALDRFAPGKRISEFRGQWFTHSIKSASNANPINYWCMATFHPAAALRNPYYAKAAREDVAQFGFYSLGVFDPIDATRPRARHKL